MTGRGPAILVVTVLALSAGAAAALVAGSVPAARSEERGREFQRLVGGLGFGAATDISRCAAAFDPRLESECAKQSEPLPLIRGACLLHANSLLSPPRASPRTARSR